MIKHNPERDLQAVTWPSQEAANQREMVCYRKGLDISVRDCILHSNILSECYKVLQACEEDVHSRTMSSPLVVSGW